MPGGSEVESFLSGWLTARLRDEPAKKMALALYTGLPTLLGGDSPRRFQEGLFGRIAGLKGIVEAMTRDGDPTFAPSSPRGRWSREARTIVDRWDEARWAGVAADLSRVRNSLMLAVVSQSLEEAVGQEPAGAPAGKLRTLDEREFLAIPLPPGPQAPWDAAAYLFPVAGRAIADQLDQLPLDPALQSKVIADLRRPIDAGWPILKARLEESLGPILDVGPAAVEIRAILQRLRPEHPPTATPTPARTSPEAPVLDAARIEAGRRLDDLARALRADSAPEALTFAERIENLRTLPGAASLPGLHQELVGCLAALDEAGAAARWRKPALDCLARIARDIGGGQILDDGLLGQPLGRWTDFVTIEGYDDHAPPGEPRRITRVEAIGYLLVFADGSRRALVRARVLIAL